MEVLGSRQPHSSVEASWVWAVGLSPELQFPEADATWQVLGHHIILVVDLNKVVDHALVVWHVCVAKLVDLMEDVMDLFDVFGRAHPQFAFGCAQALGLDILDLHNGEIALLSPLEFLVEEVKHREVQAPHVVAACQVHVIMGI